MRFVIYKRGFKLAAEGTHKEMMKNAEYRQLCAMEEI